MKSSPRSSVVILILVLIVIAGIYFYSKEISSVRLVNPFTGKIDVQYNYFSISDGQMATGLGGPNPEPAVLPDPLVFSPENPAQYSAILKISDHTTGLVLDHVRVAQGNQDSLNINNGVTNVSVSGDFSVAGAPGLRVITIKGGSRGIVMSGTLHGHGTSEDVKIGDWSDQNYATSSDIDISGLHEADGSDIKVVIGRASDIVMNSSEKIDLAASGALKIYWQLKYLIRQLLGIPMGTPGPSWMS